MSEFYFKKTTWDGATIEHLGHGFGFRDNVSTPLPQGKKVVYVLNGKDIDGGKGFRYAWEKDLNSGGNQSIALAGTRAQFNRRYRLILSRYEVDDTILIAWNTKPNVSSGWEKTDKDSIIVYTPAFPHAWLQGKQRSLDPKNPYVLSGLDEAVAFEKIPGREAYRIKITDLSETTLIYNEVHDKQNSEYWFWPSNVEKMAFEETYVVRGKAKVTKFRGHFGPRCYIRTPVFPEPVFQQILSPLNPTDPIKLADKVGGATGYTYQVTWLKSPPKKDNLLNSSNSTTLPNGQNKTVYLKQFINNNTPASADTFHIRCRAHRQYLPTVDQSSEYCDWVTFTKK